jgi:hypothetical protein
MQFHDPLTWNERTRTNDDKSATQEERTKRTKGHTPYKGVSASESRLTSGPQFSIFPSGRNGISSGQDLRPGKPERGRGLYWGVTPFVRSGLTQDIHNEASRAKRGMSGIPLIKIGAKVISHGRSIAFQMAEVAIPRQMFQEILRLIAELRPKPLPAPA